MKSDGHKHEALDLTSKRRYINSDSAGCYDKAESRLVLLNNQQNKLHIEKYSVPYDDNGLIEAFDNRNVPARDFIRQVFIKRKK